MYQGWVTHTHTHLGGRCPHTCSYCSVQSMAKRFPVLQKRYSGPLRLLENEFNVNYGKGKVIFMEHCNDLFAVDVPLEFIRRISLHARQYGFNDYVWQTKNPARYLTLDEYILPANSILGCTIETNRDIPTAISRAPQPVFRHHAMMNLKAKYNVRTFITVEPVMDFDVDILACWIIDIKPDFLNLGADSKNHHLPAPVVEYFRPLIFREVLDGFHKSLFVHL